MDTSSKWFSKSPNPVLYTFLSAWELWLPLLHCLFIVKNLLVLSNWLSSPIILAASIPFKVGLCDCKGRNSRLITRVSSLAEHSIFTAPPSFPVFSFLSFLLEQYLPMLSRFDFQSQFSWLDLQSAGMTCATMSSSSRQLKSQTGLTWSLSRLSLSSAGITSARHHVQMQSRFP